MSLDRCLMNLIKSPSFARFGVLSPPVTPCNNSSILLESCESPGVGRDPLHIAKVVNWTVQRWAPNDHRTLSIERSKGFCTGTNLTNAFELMLNLPRVKLIILLMEDSLCPLIDSFSHCLQGFYILDGAGFLPSTGFLPWSKSKKSYSFIQDYDFWMENSTLQLSNRRKLPDCYLRLQLDHPK